MSCRVAAVILSAFLLLLTGCAPFLVPVVEPLPPPGVAPEPAPPVNQEPIALFSISHREPIVGELVEFDGTASRDPDGSVVAYHWIIGTRAYTGPACAVTFDAAGAVAMSLTVYDAQSASNTIRRTITVTEYKPPEGGGCGGGRCS